MELVSYKAIVFDLGGNMKGYEGMEMSEKDFEKKKELFLEQKKIMDTFLKTGAISQMQYEKSYGDLVKKMGMESIAEELKSKK